MIPAVKEIRGTEVYHAIIKGLWDLVDNANVQTFSAAQSKPIEDVRFRAGVAVGLRQAISALTQTQETQNG